MIRQASIITIAVALIPTFAFAQGAQFTVSVQSAAVRKAPSTGSPVVGQAARGAVLEVTRDIGSWVKVAWPDAPDGVGYVHVSMGTIAQRASREERLATAFASLPPPEIAAPESAALQASPQPVAGQLTGAVYVPPPTHMVGFGGQMSGATPAFGFTSRVWSRSRIGLQLDSVAVDAEELVDAGARALDGVRAERRLLVAGLRRQQPVAAAICWQRRRDDAVEADERHARSQRGDLEEWSSGAGVRGRRGDDSEHAALRDQRRCRLRMGR